MRRLRLANPRAQARPYIAVTRGPEDSQRATEPDLGDDLDSRVVTIASECQLNDERGIRRGALHHGPMRRPVLGRHRIVLVAPAEHGHDGVARRADPVRGW
jgi:hypothetical protein